MQMKSSSIVDISGKLQSEQPQQQQQHEEEWSEADISVVNKALQHYLTLAQESVKKGNFRVSAISEASNFTLYSITWSLTIHPFSNWVNVSFSSSTECMQYLRKDFATGSN